MFGDLWEVVLNPVFLITVGLVGLPFLILLYSVWVTWQENRGNDEP